MGLTLSSPPGFADVSDAVLAHDEPAFGFNLAKVYLNGLFALVRTEVFPGLYKHGDTVPLPVSARDGYAYSRDELIYIWTVQNSVDQKTGWISGKDSLWYAAWSVDQSSGLVASDEWYRTSGHSGVPNGQVNGTHTNDGTLFVWTIAQRGLSDLLMASSPSYSALTSSWFSATDKPFSEQLAQGLNHDAKFALLNHEVFDLGEYTHGTTVTLPISRVDGYHYSAAECKFLFSWRWTFGSAKFEEPPASYGQLGPMTASVDSSGNVTIAETFVDNSGNPFTVNVGRITVFAFCQRSGTPGTITPTANSFAEIDFDSFLPGNPLPYTTIQQIVKNILQALLTPERFGPTTHQNGDTIALPTSAIDGYIYSRSELTYLWTWTDTTPAGGSHIRVEAFHGRIDPATGVVALGTYRLPPGGPADTVGDPTLPRISVITLATRFAQAPADPGSVTTTPGTAASSVQTDVPAFLLSVNTVAITGDGANLSDITPAAPSGKTNVKWQNDALSPTDASAYMPLLVGDSGSGGASGAVPAPAAGDAAAGKFLKADGTWAVPVTLPNFADGEVVSASGTAATLAHTPNPAASLILVVDGQVLKSGAGNDYTLSTVTISFATAPRVGANIQAWYRY